MGRRRLMPRHYASKFSFLGGVAEERLRAATRVILATDMDAPGQKLADELARRIGYAKCSRVTWPEGCKDANETFMNLGKTAVLEALANAQPYPVPEGESAEASDEAEDEAPPQRKSQATKLVALARQGDTDLFHDEAGKPYITFPNGTHQETWSLTSTPLRDWLSARYYATYNTAPGLASAEGCPEHTERHRSLRRRVPARLRPTCRARGRHLSRPRQRTRGRLSTFPQTAGRLIPAAACPVRFRRPTGLLPLPYPTRGGDLSALRKLINVKDERDFTLIIAWLLGTLRPDGPYTILCLLGEQGTAKTTLARMLRSLVDPNTLLLRAEPRDEGDLLIAAHQRSGGRVRQPLPSVPLAQRRPLSARLRWWTE